MDTQELCHKGTVKRIADSTLYIEIERRSACATCHAKSTCMVSDHKDEIVSVHTTEPNNYVVGEVVNLSLKKSLAAKAVVIGYLCPFLVLVLSLFPTYYITKNELLSICIAFTATTLYYLFLRKIHHSFQNKFSFSVDKISEKC